jgi:hypothetical protein
MTNLASNLNFEDPVIVNLSPTHSVPGKISDIRFTPSKVYYDVRTEYLTLREVDSALVGPANPSRINPGEASTLPAEPTTMEHLTDYLERNPDKRPFILDNNDHENGGHWYIRPEGKDGETMDIYLPE